MHHRPIRSGSTCRGSGPRRRPCRRRSALVGDDPPAGDGHDGPARDLKTLPGSVVGAMMQDRLTDRLLALRIPKDDVGIEADADRTLARIEAIELGVIGRRSARRSRAARCGPSRRPPRTGSAAASRRPGMPFGTQRNEVRALRLSLPLRLVIAKRAMVGREGLEHAAAEALPDRLLALLVARRRESRHISRRSYPC